MTKKRTSYRLSEDGKLLLAALAAWWGMSQTAVLEMLIRRAWQEVDRKKGARDDDPKNHE